MKTSAVNLNINEIIIKILTFKSVPKDLLTYYLDRTELREAWSQIINALPLEAIQTNGRISTLQEAMDMVLKVLRKMIMKELEKETGTFEGLGLIRDYSKLSYKEILEKYLEGEE